jgi:hypothetical protein
MIGCRIFLVRSTILACVIDTDSPVGGNGFIAVNNTDSYNLPDPILFQGQNAYSIAVFHQLHCLVCVQGKLFL